MDWDRNRFLDFNVTKTEVASFGRSNNCQAYDVKMDETVHHAK